MEKSVRRPTAAVTSACTLIQRFPVPDLPIGLVTVDAISLLNPADEFVALAIDLRQRIIGKLAPLLLDLPAHLLPVAFDTIPIHGALLGLLKNFRPEPDSPR
jgi:hypothetical protein